MHLFDLLRFSILALRQKRVLAMSSERILALQERRFRAMLRHAALRSAFYRDKFRGIDLDSCRVADLPVTTKPEIMKHLDRVVTDPEVRREDLERFMEDPANVSRLYLGKYAASRTSGSQGQPLLVLLDRPSLDVLFALQLTRANLRRPGVLEAIRRLFRPGRLAIVGMHHGFYPSNSVWEHMPRAVRSYLKVLRVASSDADLIDRLNAFRPTSITGYVSALEVLMLAKEKLRLTPELQQVVTTSEVLTAKTRQEFQEAFGVPVLDNYSMAECNHLSNGCPTHGGVHVNSDWAILEVVDEHHRPVPPGMPGYKLLLTNLANQVQPFIRYEIGDRVTSATEPCACGNPLPRLARIDGRNAEFFWVEVNGARRQLLSFVFKLALDFVPEAREWQAIQAERNRIRLKVEPRRGASLDVEHVRHRVAEQLASHGLAEAVQVEIETVSRLTPDPVTGKFRRIVKMGGT